jgi:hypothetical protein
MRQKLNAAYGFANMDPSVILTKLRSISFHPNKNPSVMLNQIDPWTAELESQMPNLFNSWLMALWRHIPRQLLVQLSRSNDDDRIE